MQSARNLQRLKNSIQSCQRSLKSRKFTRGVSQGDCIASDVSFSHYSGADSRSLAVGLSHSCQPNKQCENNSFKLGRAIPMSADLSMSANLYGCYFQANTIRTNLFLVDRTSLSICKYFGNSVNVSLSNTSKPLTTVYRRSFGRIQKTAHGLELSSEEIGVQDGVANAKAEKSLNALGLISSLFAPKPGHPRKWFPWSWNPKPKGFHSSSASLNTARATPEISFDGPQKDESPEDSLNGSEQIFLGDRTLKLQSGACYLPHPEKEETGGEDAHFICVDEHAIGVADGVGGWALHGVNSGEYSRELMSKAAAAIQEEPKGAIDLLRVLEKAYLDTRAKGSSTACLLALMEKGLHAINLGDSGFLVVRDGCTVFRSPVQQHDFNFTYQLESGGNSDLPSSAEVFNIQVAPGDVIIAGTDGLFDNLYNNEVTGVVVHAVRAGLGPQVTAQKIAALARQRAQDSHRQTPFSTAAQEAGYRYYGGKLDDITVVVSYVCSSTANKAAE